MEGDEGALIDHDKIIRECNWAIGKIEDQGHTTMTSKGFFRDVIDLLKQQEPVKAISASDEAGCMWYYVCPECRIAIDHKDKFCRHCGRRLKWE